MTSAVEIGSSVPQAAVEDITPAGIVDPLGISSKIKNDLFDRSGRAKENSLGLLTQVPLIGIGALGLGALFADHPPIAAVAALAAPYTLFCIESLRHLLEISLDEEKHSIMDKDLGYRADRLVYAGSGLSIDGTELKKGDNFYYLQLPYVKHKGQFAPDQLDSIRRLYAVAIKDFRTRVSARDYQAVAIDVQDNFIGADPLIKTAPRISRKALLAGKDATTLNSNVQAAIFPRETLDLMALEPREIFERAVDALDQSIGRKISGARLIEELRGLRFQSGERMFGEARRLRVKVDHLFDSQAEALFNGLPEVSVDRSADIGFIRRRSGSHPTLTATKALRGELLQQISYTQGDKRTLLRLDRVLDEVIALDSKDRAILLSYAISHMLNSAEMLEEMIREKGLNKEAVLKDLADWDITVEDGKWIMPLAALPRLRRMPNIYKKTLLTAVVAGAVFTGGKAVSEIVNFKLPPMPAIAAG